MNATRRRLRRMLGRDDEERPPPPRKFLYTALGLACLSVVLVRLCTLHWASASLGKFSLQFDVGPSHSPLLPLPPTPSNPLVQSPSPSSLDQTALGVNLPAETGFPLISTGLGRLSLAGITCDADCLPVRANPRAKKLCAALFAAFEGSYKSLYNSHCLGPLSSSSPTSPSDPLSASAGAVSNVGVERGGSRRVARQTLGSDLLAQELNSQSEYGSRHEHPHPYPNDAQAYADEVDEGARMMPQMMPQMIDSQVLNQQVLNQQLWAYERLEPGNLVEPMCTTLPELIWQSRVETIALGFAITLVVAMIIVKVSSADLFGYPPVVLATTLSVAGVLAALLTFHAIEQARKAVVIFLTRRSPHRAHFHVVSQAHRVGWVDGLLLALSVLFMLAETERHFRWIGKAGRAAKDAAAGAAVGSAVGHFIDSALPGSSTTSIFTNPFASHGADSRTDSRRDPRREGESEGEDTSQSSDGERDRHNEEEAPLVTPYEN